MSACLSLYVCPAHTHPAIIAQLDAPHWVSHPRGQQPKTKKNKKINPRPSPPPHPSKIPSSPHFRQEQPLVQWLIFRRRPVAPHASIADVHSMSALSALITFGDYCFSGREGPATLQHPDAYFFYICRLPLPSKRTDLCHVYIFLI